MRTDEECAGAGRCHGCMSWCDTCGSVSLTCDAPQGTCSRHHCRSCLQLLGHDDHNGADYTATCRSCVTVQINEDQREHFERALEAGDYERCQQLANDLEANPGPPSMADLLWFLYRPIGGHPWGQ